MEVLRKENGFTIVKLHYSDHPQKNLAWVESVKRSYPSEDMWNQEQELDFTKQVGRRVYPGFTKFNIRSILHNPYRHVIRGWDFGYRHCAVVFAQVNDKDQFCVLREVLGANKTLSEFAKIVKAVSREHYSTQFDDYCDPAGRSKSDKSERTSVDILRNLGIKCRMKETGVLDGLNLIRQLILKRDDDECGLYIDSGCDNLIEGFFGGYTLKEDSEEPDKTGDYDHVMDALRYAVVNVFDQKRFETLKPCFPFARKRSVDDVSGY